MTAIAMMLEPRQQKLHRHPEPDNWSTRALDPTPSPSRWKPQPPGRGFLVFHAALVDPARSVRATTRITAATFKYPSALDLSRTSFAFALQGRWGRVPIQRECRACIRPGSDWKDELSSQPVV